MQIIGISGSLRVEIESYPATEIVVNGYPFDRFQCLVKALRFGSAWVQPKKDERVTPFSTKCESGCVCSVDVIEPAHVMLNNLIGEVSFHFLNWISVSYWFHRGSVQLVPDIGWLHQQSIPFSGTIESDSQDVIIHAAENFLVVISWKKGYRVTYCVHIGLRLGT